MTPWLLLFLGLAIVIIVVMANTLKKQMIEHTELLTKYNALEETNAILRKQLEIAGSTVSVDDAYAGLLSETGGTDQRVPPVSETIGDDSKSVESGA